MWIIFGTHCIEWVEFYILFKFYFSFLIPKMSTFLQALKTLIESDFIYLTFAFLS